jgi:hypothetical protein
MGKKEKVGARRRSKEERPSDHGADGEILEAREEPQ